MEKTDTVEQEAEKRAEKKTGFTLDEYDQLLLDLDFIVAATHAGYEHDGAYDVKPILNEAIMKGHAVRELIEGMAPGAEAQS